MASRTAVNVARRAASTLTGASRSRLVAPSAASLNNFAAAPSAQQPLRRSATTSAGAALASLAAASPHVDVVRYEHKNVKWTLSHVDKNSEALAVGFIENGLRPGDVVLSWLPQHFGEEVRTQKERRRCRPEQAEDTSKSRVGVDCEALFGVDLVKACAVSCAWSQCWFWN